MKVPDPTLTPTSSPLPPSNGHAIERSGEGDRDLVALLDRGPFGLRRKRAALVGNAGQRLGDVRFADFGNWALKLDGLEIGKCDRRDNFQRNRVGKILFTREDAFDLSLIFRQLDLRLHSKLEVVVGDDFGIGFADQRLNGLGHDRLAIDLLKVFDRHLARTKSIDADLALDFVQPGVAARLQIALWHNDLVFALQAFGPGLGHLHGNNSVF